MTVFSPDFSPFWNHINWSDDPYKDLAGAETLRVQLIETLHPSTQAEACILGVKATTKELDELVAEDGLFKNRMVPFSAGTDETITIYDPMGVNFGGIGEWFDVFYRHDLQQWTIIGSKGLVRRVEVVDDEMDASDKFGVFRVSRLEPPEELAPGGDDTYNTDIKITVHFEFFEKDLPKKYLIGDRFYAVFFHDSFDDGSPGTKTEVDEEGNTVITPTSKDFADYTGRWELMPMGANVAVVGWVTTTIPAAAVQTAGSAPGTTSGTNIRIQQLNDSDPLPANWVFEDCLDGNGAIIEIRSFNICEVDIDASQRVILDYIKGYPFVNCVCCPP